MSAADHVEPVLQSLAKAERHMKSEYGTRMVGVIDTIAANPHFAMMLAPRLMKVCSGRDEVDAMYKASVDFAEPRASLCRRLLGRPRLRETTPGAPSDRNRSSKRKIWRRFNPSSAAASSTRSSPRSTRIKPR